MRRRHAAAAQLEEEKQATIKRLLQRTVSKKEDSKTGGSKDKNKNNSAIEQDQHEDLAGSDSVRQDLALPPNFIRYTQRVGESFLSFPKAITQ